MRYAYASERVDSLCVNWAWWKKTILYHCCFSRQTETGNRISCCNYVLE